MNKQFKQGPLGVAIATVAALAIQVLFGGIKGWVDAVGTVVMTVGIYFALAGISKRRESSYAERMEAADPVDLDVRINGVKVGTVSDAQYAAMQRYAYRDMRNAASQLLNVLHMAMVILDKIVIGVPLLVFWGGLALAVFSPNDYTSLVHELQKVTPATLAASSGHLLQVGFGVLMMAFMLMFIFGYRFGFRNHYAEAVERMIRQHCNTPAEGNVQLSRALDMADGAPAN